MGVARSEDRPILKGLDFREKGAGSLNLGLLNSIAPRQLGKPEVIAGPELLADTWGDVGMHCTVRQGFQT